MNTALPVRQTASIFKQPVTKITNHPSNKVKSDPQKAVEQPRQVSPHTRPSGHGRRPSSSQAGATAWSVLRLQVPQGCRKQSQPTRGHGGHLGPTILE